MPTASSSQVNPRAVTFRDATGEVIATTWGGTWCWHPLNPTKWATTSEDGEDAHIIRCRQCPGCLELDRRELADRLEATFKEEVDNLWVVMVEVNAVEVARFAASLSRISRSWRTRGWCRIGASRIAIVVAGRKPRWHASRLCFGRTVSVLRVLRSRTRRAWRELTAGILYSRSVYGENANRWYIRGLKRVPRTKRVGVWRGRVRSSHPEMVRGVAGARAGVSIHAPEAYRPPRLLKRAAANRGRFAGVGCAPEPIAAVLADLPFSTASTTFAIPGSVPRVSASAQPSMNFGDAKRSTLKEGDKSKGLGNRYSSSRGLDSAELDAWVARMTARVRPRGAPEG
jgi:hypothetical protein